MTKPSDMHSFFILLWFWALVHLYRLGKGLRDGRYHLIEVQIEGQMYVISWIFANAMLILFFLR